MDPNEHVDSHLLACSIPSVFQGIKCSHAQTSEERLLTSGTDVSGILMKPILGMKARKAKVNQQVPIGKVMLS